MLFKEICVGELDSSEIDTFELTTLRSIFLYSNEGLDILELLFLLLGELDQYFFKFNSELNDFYTFSLDYGSPLLNFY